MNSDVASRPAEGTLMLITNTVQQTVVNFATQVKNKCCEALTASHVFTAFKITLNANNYFLSRDYPSKYCYSYLFAPDPAASAKFKMLRYHTHRQVGTGISLYGDILVYLIIALTCWFWCPVGIEVGIGFGIAVGVRIGIRVGVLILSALSTSSTTNIFFRNT